MSEILGTLAGAMTSGATGGIISAVGAAAKTAAAIAEKAQQGQLIDAGEAVAHAANLKAINDQLQKFKNAVDRVDSDPAYARDVLDAFTIRD